jgi:hypothetical protein
MSGKVTRAEVETLKAEVAALRAELAAALAANAGHACHVYMVPAPAVPAWPLPYQVTCEVPYSTIGDTLGIAAGTAPVASTFMLTTAR